MKYSLIILYSFVSITCFSQNSIYTWKSTFGTTAYSGEFDSTIISKSMLDDMCMLCNKHIPLPDLSYYYQAENPDTILYKLDSTYDESIKWINSLNILDSSKWDTIINYRIELLTNGCHFIKTIIEAYNNPTILEERYPLDTCSQFIQIMIIGGDSMLNFWKDYTYQRCYKSNIDPESCFERLYTSKMENDDKYKYVRLKLLTSAWRNCYAQNHPRDYEYIDLNEEFKSLFISVKSYNMFQ